MNEPLRLGRYELHRELGRGGMGAVYAGVDTQLGRPVAIKRILGQVEPEALLRFQREASLTSRIEHPSVARLLDVVLQGPGAPFLVLELIEGRDLEAIGREERLPSAEVRRILAEVAEAVAAAHASGVLHRDLKPSNVMLRSDGRAVVLDFGVARSLLDERQSLTSTGELLGTAAYMAPEQAHGRPVPASDQYALGGILYFCLTRQPPFVGPSTLAILASAEHEPPRRPRDLVPDVDPELERIALRCLAKAPAARFPDVATLARSLRALEHDDDDPDLERAPPVQPWRGWVGVAALLAVVGGLVAAAVAGRTSSAVAVAPTTSAAPSPAALPEPASATPAPLAPEQQPAPDLSRIRAGLGRLADFQARPLTGDPAEEQRLVTALRDDVQQLREAAGAVCEELPRSAAAHLARAQVSRETLALEAARGAAETARALGGDPAALELLTWIHLELALDHTLRSVEFSPERAAEDLASATEALDALAGKRALAPVERALSSIASRRFDRAFEQLGELDETRAVLWARCLASFFRGGEGQLLDTALRKLLATFPRDPRARVLRGALRITQQDPKAEVDMAQVMGYGRPVVWVLALRTEQYAQSGKLVRAGKTIPFLKSIDGAYPRIPVLMSLIQLRSGKLRAAAEEARGILERSPEHHEALALLATIAVQQRDLSGAVKLLRRAIAQRPDWSFHHSKLAFTLQRLGRDREAIAAYQALLQLDPERPRAWVQLGVLYGKMQQHELAERAESFALKRLDRPGQAVGGDPRLEALREEAHFNRANARFHRGQELLRRSRRPEGTALVRAAGDDYTEAIKLNPDSALAYKGRSVVRAYLKELRASALDLEQYLRCARPRGAKPLRDRIEQVLGRPSRY